MGEFDKEARTPRSLNLGRVVLIIGGLVACAALTSVVKTGASAGAWAATFLGVVAGFGALILLGRSLGGRAALRWGQDRERGELTGAGLAVGLPVLAITLSRWLGLG